MRCRVSRAEASPRPSMSKRGSPGRSSTSMLRERASIPQGAADRARTIMARDSSRSEVGSSEPGSSPSTGSRRIPCTRREDRHLRGRGRQPQPVVARLDPSRCHKRLGLDRVRDRSGIPASESSSEEIGAKSPAPRSGRRPKAPPHGVVDGTGDRRWA